MKCWSLVLVLLPWSLALAGPESDPVRPEGGAYLPPPFTPLSAEGALVRCLGRAYDLSGVVPQPTVAGRPVLQDAVVRLNGAPLAPPPLRWVLTTPAVVAAERAWRAGDLSVRVRQTVEYDGFVTVDLTVGPGTVRELVVALTYRPEASALYHVPVFSPTYAGRWPQALALTEPVAQVWGGDERAGLATYVSTRRHWRGAAPGVELSRDGDGPGRIRLNVVTAPLTLTEPTTWRFGFIATPVKPMPARHLQLYALDTGRGEPEPLTDRLLFWASLSDHYATFVTNDPKRDAERRAMVAAVHAQGKQALAYTTYMHVEEGAVPAPADWPMLDPAGKPLSRSIGGSQADLNRVFIAPGSPSWLAWKLKDLEHALDAYGLDGFYVDTSYLIMPMVQPRQDLGWVDAAGRTQADFPIWSMRAVWREVYELLCRKRGGAAIYAHHKGGCPAALAAFTSAFCDGEQYTGQSIRNLTLDAVRAQISGRTVGAPGYLIEQFYRSAQYGLRERSQHDNPTETVMLALLNNVLPTGYPGLHPVRELLALRDDLGLAEASWTGYDDPRQPWSVAGAPDVAVSSYRTAAGDTLLALGNPAFAPRAGRLTGPAADSEGRTLVRIDVFARLGRSSPDTPGYRWEPADAAVTVPRRSLALYAWLRDPAGRPRFAAQRGFVAGGEPVRQAPVPVGARLLDSFDDPDWVLANDDGTTSLTTDAPVDTRAALRVSPRPQHNAAALLHTFVTPEDWTREQAVTLWLRPAKAQPVRAFELRLRNNHQYGPPLRLSAPADDTVLPAGQWTQLRFALDSAPRQNVMMLRLYYHRGLLNQGPFDLDELLIWGAGTGQGGGGQAIPGGPVAD